MERLEKQIAFLREIDKVKQVFRQTKLLDGSRYENDAEHGWHVAVMAMVLAEHISRSIKICWTAPSGKPILVRACRSALLG